VCGSADEAVKAAQAMGFPVVLKIASADFPHKSDAGLVLLGVADAPAVREGYATLMQRACKADPQARIDGVSVQEQVQGGVEMILGLVNDPLFGPSLSVGMGGIFTEALKDSVVCPLPVDAQDVRDMIGRLRMGGLLQGLRGRPAADIEAVVRAALALAALGEAAGPALAEVDINPLIALPDRAVAVDALAVARR